MKPDSFGERLQGSCRRLYQFTPVGLTPARAWTLARGLGTKNARCCRNLLPDTKTLLSVVVLVLFQI